MARRDDEGESRAAAEARLLESLNAIPAMAGAHDHASLDSVSQGWGGFATCGVAQTGGWAKPDALYAVRPSYDLASEEFRVSYLAHEGEHFADYAKYPMLEQPEPEYRAKLAEIALSTTTTAKLRESSALLASLGAATAQRFLPDEPGWITEGRKSADP